MTDETTNTVGEEAAASPPNVDLPGDPAEAIEVLIKALTESRQAEESRLDDLKRVAAEFENYRKRAERDRIDTIERASQRLVESLLPVLDSFDGAFAHDAQTPGEELLKKGVTSIFHQLMEILEREGLVPIEAAGQPFDPELHEAVTGGAGDDLLVSAEMRRGYTLRGRVIRPSMVAVAPMEEAGEA